MSFSGDHVSEVEQIFDAFFDFDGQQNILDVPQQYGDVQQQFPDDLPLLQDAQQPANNDQGLESSILDDQAFAQILLSEDFGAPVLPVDSVHGIRQDQTVPVAEAAITPMTGPLQAGPAWFAVHFKSVAAQQLSLSTAQQQPETIDPALLDSLAETTTPALEDWNSAFPVAQLESQPVYPPQATDPYSAQTEKLGFPTQDPIPAEQSTMAAPYSGMGVDFLAPLENVAEAPEPAFSVASTDVTPAQEPTPMAPLHPDLADTRAGLRMQSKERRRGTRTHRGPQHHPAAAQQPQAPPAAIPAAAPAPAPAPAAVAAPPPRPRNRQGVTNGWPPVLRWHTRRCTDPRLGCRQECPTKGFPAQLAALSKPVSRKQAAEMAAVPKEYHIRLWEHVYELPNPMVPYS